MKTNSKILISLISVLILGFFAGFICHKTLVNNRIHKIQKMNRSNHLADRIIDKVDASDEQADQIKLIVKDDLKQVKEQRKAHFEENKKRMTKMFDKIGEHLDNEQLAKLEKIKKRWLKKTEKRERRKKNRKRRE